MRCQSWSWTSYLNLVLFLCSKLIKQFMSSMSESDIELKRKLKVFYCAFCSTSLREAHLYCTSSHGLGHFILLLSLSVKIEYKNIQMQTCNQLSLRNQHSILYTLPIRTEGLSLLNFFVFHRQHQVMANQQLVLQPPTLLPLWIQFSEAYFQFNCNKCCSKL